MPAATANKETLGFQAEVKQLLHLVAHALYSNKEIFLRELISNASDAADKLRFEALKDDGLLQGQPELKVTITLDKDARTITINDTGIGMSRDDVIEHLGTIAKSGTKEFLANLSGDQAKDSSLIGQFGVGFYSAFIVADQVTVITRRAGLDEQDAVMWVSSGEGDYTIETVSKAERGTTIILHLRDDEDEFLENYRVRGVVQKYSDHIGLPVYMQKEVMPSQDEEKKEDTTEADKAPEFEVVNKARALWTLPKKDIKEDEYQEFYKHISHDFQNPLAWTHNRVEGKFDYTLLLYLPERAPFDLMQRDKPHGLKLYVQRVFIMDDAEQFLPNYLRFVKGVVDSNDLPLNISRELLQRSAVVDALRKACTARSLSLLESLADKEPEKYQNFWDQFGQVMKEGPGEDFSNKDKVAKLLRFATTRNTDAKQTVSLDDYVSKMKEGQEKIYYITADNYHAAINSPHLEVFKQKGIEVVLLFERIDEWLVSHLNEFDGKQLQSVAKGDLDLDAMEDEKTKEEHKKAEENLADFTKQVKEALGERVKEVKITHRLTDSPACIVVDQHDMSMQLQRLMQEAGQAMPESQPILELNPEHSIVLRLKDEVDRDRFNDWCNILLDQAILAEGGHLKEPASFVKRLNKMLLELS